MMQSPDMNSISIVVGTYNRLPFLRATIATLRNEVRGIGAEIIVIDGGSTDGTTEWLVQQKDIITILQHNRGEWNGRLIKRRSWGYFMNLGFRAASGKYICMLSDDCLVIPGALRNGIRTAESSKKNVGMVAFYWRNWPEQENYWVGVAWGNRMFVNHGIYLREALEKVHFLDADNFFFYHADGDVALRIWDAGYECVAGEDSFIEHYSDANIEVRATNQDRQKADWNTYTERWKYLKMPAKDWIEKPYKDSSGTAKKYWENINQDQSKKSLWRRVKK